MSGEQAEVFRALRALYLQAPKEVVDDVMGKFVALLDAVSAEVQKAREVVTTAMEQLRERAEQAELDASRLVSARDLQIRDLSESLDNIRAALGQHETHHLIMADDVKELVDAVEQCGRDGGCRASAVLRGLRER